MLNASRPGRNPRGELKTRLKRFATVSDIALDSTPEASKTPSRMTDSQTPAQQPETQRRNEAERGSPTASRTGASGRKGGRRMISKDIQRLQNKMCLINSHRPCKHS